MAHLDRVGVSRHGHRVAVGLNDHHRGASHLARARCILGSHEVEFARTAGVLGSDLADANTVAVPGDSPERLGHDDVAAVCRGGARVLPLAREIGDVETAVLVLVGGWVRQIDKTR